MNVLDYSIRLGKLLRKTREGKNLFQLEASIEEKYKGNLAFRHYEQFAEKKAAQYYFYSWDMAYKTFLNVLTDDSIEHRKIFIPTAELISSDIKIKEIALTAKSFGNIFEQLVAVIILGGEYEEIIPDSWKYKIRNAISDVQIAVERTLLMRTFAIFFQKHPDLLNNVATQKYLTEREEKKLLPFSEEAIIKMTEAKDVSEEEKVLYEKMYLIMEAVKTGIFYGFWGMINEVREDELLEDAGLCGSPLHEVTFTYRNNIHSLMREGWLYKIQVEDENIFFMAHKKEVRIEKDNEKTTISGIVYPDDDRELFEKAEEMKQ